MVNILFLEKRNKKFIINREPISIKNQLKHLFLNSLNRLIRYYFNPNSNQTTMKFSLVIFVPLVVLALLVKVSMAKDYCVDDEELEDICYKCKQVTQQDPTYELCCAKEDSTLEYCRGVAPSVTDTFL